MNILFYCSEYPPYVTGGIGSATKIVAEELAKRKAEWSCPEPKVTTGYLARYAKLVSSADKGAILE